eukprot:3495371-Pleurochrysis_carterae.AAC.1
MQPDEIPYRAKKGIAHRVVRRVPKTAEGPDVLSGVSRAASAAQSDNDGSPGGCSESPSARCTSELEGRGASRHEYSISSKYTSDDITTRPELGTHT